MGSRTQALLWIAWLLVASGCGQTFVVKVPEMPSFLGGEDPPARSARAQQAQLEHCPYMTVMIDYSREGDPVVGERVASAMAKEFKEQARGYVQQASAAVYPFAQRLCAFEVKDRKREQSIEEQLPAGPAPL